MIGAKWKMVQCASLFQWTISMIPSWTVMVILSHILYYESAWTTNSSVKDIHIVLAKMSQNYHMRNALRTFYSVSA